MTGRWLVRTKGVVVARARGDRQSGAGTVEYIGVIIGVAAMVAVLLIAFPSVGEQLACRLSQVVGSITGGSASCSGASGGQGQAGPDSSGFVEPRTTTTGPGTGRVEFVVTVPEGQNWTVESDQPWLTVPDNRVFDGPTIRGFYGPFGGGNGPGSLTAVVHTNPDADGKPRTATLTFTGPNGEKFTQEITQAGGTAQTVVLGDSFSAGIGSGKNHPDAPTDDGCHRSSMSWGRQLEAGTATGAGTPSISLSAFGACSGATVDGTDLTGRTGAPSLLAQIEANKDALAQADQVAFSTGGNDIGFAPIVQDCVVPINSVANCHRAVREGRWLVNGRGNEASPLSPRLEQAYRAMLEAAPNATIYVVGYPPMVELDDTGGGFLDWGEIEPENYQEVVDLLNELNFQMASTVNMVNESTPGGGRLVFVDPTKEGSPFHGHSLTDEVPFYNGLQTEWAWPPVSYQSYHPNDAGNEAYAQWVGWYMMGRR